LQEGREVTVYPYLDGVLLQFLEGWLQDPTADPRNYLDYYRDLFAQHPDDLAHVGEYEEPEDAAKRVAFRKAFDAAIPKLVWAEELEDFIREVNALRKAHGEKLMRFAAQEAMLTKGLDPSRPTYSPEPPTPECN
jgi:hypothetical protein